ncbi:MAG: alpha-amylase family glycosyl hydrolase [Bacteroidota bacterium]
MVKSQDGGSQTSDFLYDVGTFQLVLNAPTNSTTIVDSGETLSISAVIGTAADFTLTANGNVVDTQNGITEYTNSVVVNGDTAYELEATDGNNTETLSFQAVIRPTVPEIPLPEGLTDGINLDPNDPTTATLVLYAPGKEFIHVMGNFNDWMPGDANFLMNKDSTQDRFWYRIDGLDPNEDNMFQYLVDLEINIADPYSTLILGEFNDQFINNTTYPDLPAYPTGQTTQAVSLLQTNTPEYTWSDATLNFQKPEKTDLVIYELLVRDFDELHSFNAIRARLDYLEALGINAIELMPVNEFDGNESWGYNPSFHMALDKYYGTPTAFKQLIDECHQRGMAVILDVVYNHGTGQHPFFRLWNTSRGGTGGQATAENPFFNTEARHSFSVFNDFNHQSQATKDYVNQTVRYWIEEFRIDGFRWDLTKGFTQNCSANDDGCTNGTQPDRIEVLKGYADTQWEVDPDFYVIFEHLGGITEEKEWADYRLDEGKGILFWNKMTDPYNETTMGYHENGKSDFSAASYQVKGFDNPAAISYMESHDEERLMYKNLEFGNVEGDYSVKELDTALERVEAAGAFFFTIPGPKLIWQFGELGYEFSINYCTDGSISNECRTGNKPIRWDYLDNPNRTAIYDTWANLITMKLNEEIFTTTDFSMDLDDPSGLKIIHLSGSGDNSSGKGNTIQSITVIGNFGMQAQEINPEFQETGTWYNLLDGNRAIEISDPNAGILLEPGEIRMFGDNPFTDPDDLDSDGVPNGEDQCPDTELGATVDVTGCAIFSLPTQNFSVKTSSETCPNSGNGSIALTAMENLSYTATLTGTAQVSEAFSESTRFENLSAGEYSVCITVDDQPDYEQCFDVTITAPEGLSVSSKVNRSTRKVALELKGGNSYEILVNKVSYYTSGSSIELNLQQAVNTIQVKTNADCQGVFKETIVLDTTVMAYPNPMPANQVSIDLAQPIDTTVTVEVFGLDGRLLSRQDILPVSGKLDVDLSAFTNGLFLINVHTQEKIHQFKIAKQ